MKMPDSSLGWTQPYKYSKETIAPLQGFQCKGKGWIDDKQAMNLMETHISYFH